MPPSTRVSGTSAGAPTPATDAANENAAHAAAAAAISTTTDAPEGSTAREWATALNVLGLEVVGRAADGWVLVRAVAFCRDGITVSAVTAGLAARLGVDTSAEVGVDAGTGGAVGNVPAFSSFCLLDCLSPPEVSLLRLLDKAHHRHPHRH